MEVAPVAVQAPPMTQPWLMAPGHYEYNGFVYDMRPEGLYRIVAMDLSTGYRDAGFRLVHAGTGVVRPLLAGIAGVCLHGDEHEGLTYDQRLEHVRSSYLAIRCGHVDHFARNIMAAVGIPSRSVSLVTLDTPTNVDDGHVITEARDVTGWVAYDLSADRAFRDINGNLLTAGQLPAAIASGAYTDDMLIKTGCTYWPSPSAISHMFAGAMEQPGGLSQWTRRIFQAVGIWHTDGRCYFKLPTGTPTAKKQWVLNLSTDYRVIDNHAVWQKMFYGG